MADLRTPVAQFFKLFLAVVLAIVAILCVVLSVTSVWWAAEFRITRERYDAVPEPATSTAPWPFGHPDHSRMVFAQTMNLSVSRAGFFLHYDHYGSVIRSDATDEPIESFKVGSAAWDRYWFAERAMAYPKLWLAPSAGFRGIGYTSSSEPGYTGGTNYWFEIVLPLPLLAVLFALYPAWRLWRWRRLRSAATRGFDVEPVAPAASARPPSDFS